MIHRTLLPLLLFLSACTTTTEKGTVDVERRQLLLVPSAQIVAMSTEAYEQTKQEAAQKNELDRNPQDPSTWGKVGRNEACPCGSGKKYKHCHGMLA